MTRPFDHRVKHVKQAEHCPMEAGQFVIIDNSAQAFIMIVKYVNLNIYVNNKP